MGFTLKMKRDYYIWVQSYSVRENGRKCDYKTWILCNSFSPKQRHFSGWSSVKFLPPWQGLEIGVYDEARIEVLSKTM